MGAATTSISSGVGRGAVDARRASNAIGGTYDKGQSLVVRLVPAILLTTSVLLPLTFLPVVQDAFALPKLVFFVAASTGVLVCLTLRPPLLERTQVIQPAVLGALIVYVLLNAIAFAFSTDRGQSLFGEPLQYQGAVTVVIYAGTLFIGVQASRSRSTTKLLFWTITLSGTAVSAYALCQMLDLDPVEWAYGAGPPERAFSSIGQANALAAYLVLVVPVALILLAGAKGSVRWALLATIGLIIIAIALTFSRTSYVALALALVLAGMPFARQVASGWTLVVGLAGCAIVLLAALSIPVLNGTGERVVDRATSISNLDDTSMQKRIGMWTVAANIVVDNPLAGTGHETYREMFTRYRDDDLPGFGTASARPESPHNNYLAIASSAGVPALAAYLTLIGVVLWHLFRSRVVGDTRFALSAITAALVGHLVTDGFMTAEITGSGLFWLLMGVGVGLSLTCHTHHLTAAHRCNRCT